MAIVCSSAHLGSTPYHHTHFLRRCESRALGTMVLQDALKAVLENARVPEALRQFMADTLNMESLQDFTNFVTQTGYENELKSMVCDLCPAVKDNALALARLRVAWRAARTQILKMEHRQSQGQASEDLDEPLEQVTQETLMGGFKARYDLELSVHMLPSDSLLGRVYRELQRATPTVISIAKVKSVYVSNVPRADRSIPIGDNIRLQLDRPQDTPPKSVVEYYTGLRVLCNAYSIAGCYQVDSKAAAGKVIMSPLSTNLNYCDFVLRVSCKHDLPLSVIAQRHESCRARTVELMRQGWPQGESLAKALQECELAWVSQVGLIPRRKLEDEQQEANKRARTANTIGSHAICKKHNDNRGCTQKESQCPDRKKHCCDVLVHDQPCGSKSHTRMSCPHWAGAGVRK